MKHLTFVTLDGDTLKVEKEDDLNGTSEFMIKQGKATELRNTVNKYKEELLALIDEDEVELKESVLKTLEMLDPVGANKVSDRKTWESQSF